MTKIIKLFVGFIILIIVGIIAISTLSGFGETLSNAATNAKNTILGTVLDLSGVKTKIQDTLEDHVSEIAAATGLSTESVEAAISNLSIEDWEVCELPDDAQVTGTYDGSNFGINGTITTYTDSSYVTVNTYGQNITLSVPESAQSYLSYLSLL